MFGTLLALAALQVPGADSLAERFAAMTAVAGFEQAMADSLVRLLPGAQRDRAGDVVVALGRGAPRRLVVCAMDEAGYVVGRVTPDGFLTLRRVGFAASRLFDQWHAGRRVTVWTAGGPRPAVTAIPSTHLLRGRRSAEEPFGSDDLYVEVGATSPAEVEALGIALIDPVSLARRPQRYGPAWLAAPNAGQRAACAALAHAVLRGAQPQRGSVTAAFVVESRIGHRGLLTVGNAAGPFSATLLLSYPRAARVAGPPFGKVSERAPPVRYAGSPVESVDLRGVVALSDSLEAWIGGRP